MYPASNFIGTDVSPRFPESIKPKNCTFQVYNVTLPSPFPENYFGYVHQRLLILGLLKDDWPKVNDLFHLMGLHELTFSITTGDQAPHGHPETWWLDRIDRGIKREKGTLSSGNKDQ